MLLLFCCYCCLYNAHVVDGAVVVVGIGTLDALHDVEPFNHLAKDGILAVQMWGAACLAVEVGHLRGHDDAMLGHGVQAFANGLQVVGRVAGAPDNIELASAGAAFWVHVIALAGHS